MQSKILRIFLLIAWFPALMLAAILCGWGLLEHQSSMIKPLVEFLRMIFSSQMVADPRHYRIEVWTLCYHYFLATELFFSMLLVLLIGPGLISQDLRFNALPLYFSRPLRRIDYLLGKLGVIAFFLAMLVIVPSIVAYILGLLFSFDITIIPQTFRLLLSSIAYGLVITLSAGLLILALSSMSRNSRYVGLLWIGIWFITSIAGSVLQNVDREQRFHAFYESFTAAQPKITGNLKQDWRIRIGRRREAEEEFSAMELKASKHNWRPMVSYTENLSRVGRALLGTDHSWKVFSELLPADRRNRFLVDYSGPQYPWYWSALVLLGIFGISAWILQFPIKSMDRLK